MKPAPNRSSRSRGRRQDAGRLPAAHHRRAARPVREGRAQGRDPGFPGRRARAAVAGRRQRRRGVRRLRAYDPHPREGQSASRRSPLQNYSLGTVIGAVEGQGQDLSLAKDLAGLKIGVTSPGSASSIGVALLLARDGRHARQGLDHRRRHRSERGRGDEVGPDRRHVEFRSGDPAARARRLDRADRRHAHQEGPGRALRRADRRLGVLHHRRLHQEESAHRPRRSSMPWSRRCSGSAGARSRRSSRPCRPNIMPAATGRPTPRWSSSTAARSRRTAAPIRNGPRTPIARSARTRRCSRTSRSISARRSTNRSSRKRALKARATR